MQHRLRFVTKHFSPTAAFNVLRVLCNALPAAGRYGNSVTRCRFGCGGPDNIRHYTSCPVYRMALWLASPAIHSAVSVPDDLVFCSPVEADRGTTLRIALAIDGLYIAHCAMRDPPRTAMRVRSILDGRLRQLARLSDFFSKRIRVLARSLDL